MNISKEQGILIRGMAIIMIVLYHFQYDMFGGMLLIDRGQGIFAWISDSMAYASQQPAAYIGIFMSLLFIGVNVFFVLSGYGLMKKFMQRKAVKMKDMFKQSLKILIPFWIAHPVIHVIDWGLKNLQYMFGFIDYKTYFLGMHSFSEYIQSLLVVPKWFSEQGILSFDGTWWFIAIIIQFYLLFPFLIKLFKKIKPLNALLICISVSFLYRLIISLVTGASPVGINEANIYLFVMFPARLSEFALGMYLALELKSIKVKHKVLSSLVLVIVGFVFQTYIQTMFMSDFLFALGITSLLYCITKPLKGYFEKILKFIGKKSYSIYLYHEPILKLILEFFNP